VKPGPGRALEMAGLTGHLGSCGPPSTHNSLHRLHYSHELRELVSQLGARDSKSSGKRGIVCMQVAPLVHNEFLSLYPSRLYMLGAPG